MGRIPRFQAGEAIYHVTSRAVHGAPLYVEDADRKTFLDQFATVCKSKQWICHAFCLMTNHYHLLIYTTEPNLAEGMQWLNGGYARAFNLRHGRSGALFQKRYHSTLVQTEAHFLVLFRYIALNPYEAGLCERPEDWPWSSFPTAIGSDSSFPFLRPEALLECFGGDCDEARRRLAAFVKDGCQTP